MTFIEEVCRKHLCSPEWFSLFSSLLCVCVWGRCERNNLTALMSECQKPLTGGRGEDKFKNEIVKVYGSLNNAYSGNRRLMHTRSGYLKNQDSGVKKGTCTAKVGVHVWHLLDCFRTHAVYGRSCLIGYAVEMNVWRSSSFCSKEPGLSDCQVLTKPMHA